VVTSDDVNVIAPVRVLKLVKPAAIVQDLSADKSNAVPLIVMVLVCGTLLAILVVTVVEKFASSPKAAANSLRVSRVVGAESIRFAIAVVTLDDVASDNELIYVLIQDVVPTFNELSSDAGAVPRVKLPGNTT
jgi:hypothetical protein